MSYPDSYFGLQNEAYFEASLATRKYQEEQAKEKTEKAIKKNKENDKNE